ncbi:MAG: O-antigen ligase family protein [Elainella sp.]
MIQSAANLSQPPSAARPIPWVAGLEVVLVLVLLLYFTEVDLDLRLIGIANFASYGLVGILLLLNLKSWKRLLYVATCDLPLLLLIGLALASFFWSAAPDFTADEVKALLRASVVGVYLAFRFTPKQQMQLFVWTVGISALLSTAFALAMPAYGIHLSGEHAGLWKGIYTHKQYLGRLMTVGLVPFLLCGLEQPKHRVFYFSGAALVLALIVLSGSRTSLSLLTVSLLLLPLYQMVRQAYRTRAMLLSLSIVLVGALIMLVTANIETIIVDVMGKSLDLNSRGPIWTYAIEKGLERPWLGYGYAGFWTSSEADMIYNNTWAGGIMREGSRFHAHNGFIDTFLQIGLVGLVICMLTFLRSIRDAAVLMTSRQYGLETFWMLQFLVITLFFNVTETRTFLASNTFWSITVSIALITKMQYKKRHRLAGTGDSPPDSHLFQAPQPPDPGQPNSPLPDVNWPNPDRPDLIPTTPVPNSPDSPLSPNTNTALPVEQMQAEAIGIEIGQVEMLEELPAE